MVSMTTFAPSLAFLEHQQRHRARFDELFARACERLDAFREDSRDRFLSSVLLMALAGRCSVACCWRRWVPTSSSPFMATSAGIASLV
jgi:hypothetical protein